MFGKFSIADAMYAPVVLRLTGYGIPLAGPEEAYARTVLKHPNLIEWIAAAQQEQQVLTEYEKEV